MAAGNDAPAVSKTDRSALVVCEGALEIAEGDDAAGVVEDDALHGA